MKIFITGAAGFIGFHLSKKLLNENFDVFGIDNFSRYYDVKLKKDRIGILSSYDNFIFNETDITDKVSLNEAFKKFQPQRVINLAAQPGVRYSLVNPHIYMDTNLVGFLNVLELCKDYKVEGIVYASSSSVYGSNEKVPFNVDQRVMNPISLYGATKRSNELLAHSYSHIYNLPTTGLRYFTVYGPWYRPDMGMFKFVKNILNNKSIDVYNDGKMRRDFTYIDDIIDGTVSALNKNYDFEIFNIGNSRSEELMDLISLIEKQTGKLAKIKFKPLQPGDMIDTYADISKSREYLDYDPSVDLTEGVPNFINWYREYYEI